MRRDLTLTGNIRKNTIDIIFIGPQLFIFIILTIVPFFVSLPLMFIDKLNFMDMDTSFVGFDNFISIFKPPLSTMFFDAVGRTALFTLINYVMVFLFGIPLALMMYELNSKIKQGLFTIIYMPYMISGLGIGMLVVLLFSSDTGSMNLLILKLGLLDNPIDIKESVISTIMVPLFVGWRYAGFNMAIFLSGLLSIPMSTVESSVVDGANYFQRFKYIYIPQIIPSIIIATILCFVGSFGVFDEPIGIGALNGNPNAQFLSVLLYKMGFGSGGNLAQTGTLSEAVTMSMVVYFPLIIIAFLLNRLQKKVQD